MPIRRTPGSNEEGLAPTDVSVTVDAQGSAADGGYKGEVVYGRVLSHGEGEALLSVLGRRMRIALSEPVRIGQMVPLRVADIHERDEPAPTPPTTSLEMADVVKSVRRFVDAAAVRLFGEAPPRPTARRVGDLDPDALLRIAVRGERPERPLVRFEPETVALSPALTAASAEDLLAAQAALERLGVPATPVTIAAALPEANDPARLVRALRGLATMDAEGTAAARAATLRTLAEFLSNISPQRHPLDAQLSAFVDQVATGGERKLVELLAALGQRARTAAAGRLLLTAKATERATSLTHDVKTQLCAFAAGAAEEGPVRALLVDAAEALTAAQLTSLHAMRKFPGAIGFVLPILTPKHTHAAQIVVQRDSPEERNRPLDARNFRIAFALETRRLGLVRVDIECVRRAVRVTIDAQTTGAAEEIRGALDGLRARLEARGFRSVAMTAQCVRRTPYGDPAREDEARTYVPAQRGTNDGAGAVHLDTKA